MLRKWIPLGFSLRWQTDNFFFRISSENRFLCVLDTFREIPTKIEFFVRQTKSLGTLGQIGHLGRTSWTDISDGHRILMTRTRIFNRSDTRTNFCCPFAISRSLWNFCPKTKFYAFKKIRVDDLKRRKLGITQKITFFPVINQLMLLS